ncbi:MAG: hypothetical protein ACI8TP_000071 [Acidimicrobiales bacterium]|jgi:hypothetical protein
MSVRVELEDIAAAVASVDGAAFLLTTNADSSPHPANVRVEFADNRFTASAGRRSCTNCAERSAVTLLWPNAGDDDMSLLVDGVARVVSTDDGILEIDPTSAIWHRAA